MAVLQQYEVPAKPEFEIALPAGAQVISFYNVDDKPYVGVLADVSAPNREARHFAMVDVRGKVDTTKVTRLVGVAVFRKGSNPLHLFECKAPEPADG